MGAATTEQQLSSKSWELSSQGAKEPEEHAGVISQREHPGSTHFTPWLSTRSREKSATRGSPQVKHSHLNSIPVDGTPPNSQPQSTPHHSLALDLGQTQQRRRCDLGLLLSRIVDAYTGGTWVPCEHTGLASAASLGQGTHREPALRALIPTIIICQ